MIRILLCIIAIYALLVIILPFVYSWHSGCTEYVCTYVPSSRFNGQCYTMFVDNQSIGCLACPWYVNYTNGHDPPIALIVNGTTCYSWNNGDSRCPMYSECFNLARNTFYFEYVTFGFLFVLAATVAWCARKPGWVASRESGTYESV